MIEQERTVAGSAVVVVAVLTYRRPDDLAALLPLLIEQTRAVPCRASVLVVDNDSEGGAREQITALASGEVRYVHEPTPGIAAARNRALDEAGDAGLLVFIDDDERPTPEWLARLLDTYWRGQPAAVVGPVVSRYEVEPGPWITAGRLFDRRRLATGTSVDVAATNNLLLDLAQQRRLGPRFDLRFGLSGGSDTLFTRALVRAGGRIVWCDEAVVIDIVPAGRVTRSWVLRRALRSGNTWSRTSIVLAGGPAARLVVRVHCTGRGLIRVLAGAAWWLIGLLTGSLRRRARGMRAVFRGTGFVVGAWGIVYSEYRRPR